MYVEYNLWCYTQELIVLRRIEYLPLVLAILIEVVRFLLKIASRKASLETATSSRLGEKKSREYLSIVVEIH